MKMPTARPKLRRRFLGAALQHRAELPAVAAPTHPALAATATHDFLVPNPRPDLTLDPHTLRMMEAG